MGNKIGKSKVPPPLRRARDVKSGRNSPLSLSKESVLSATTMNSARCLLYRDELVLTEEEDEERYSSSEHLARVCNGASASPPPFSSDEGTIIVNNGSDQDQSCSDPDAMTADMTECDRHQRQQQAFEEELFPNLVMPERILKKLTTEEWNELVHVFCLSLEQSVKSTLPQQPQPTSPSEKRRSYSNTDRHKSSTSEAKKRTATMSSYPVENKKQRSHHHHHHHQHHRKKRPLSLPPPDNTLTSTPHGHERERRKRKMADSTNPEDSFPPHESHHRTRCHSNSQHCRKKNCSHHHTRYITLGQLKDLGLALNTKETTDGPGAEPNDHHKSLRRSITSPHNLEQLCYLGPETVARGTGGVDDEQDSSASNMAVADYDMCSTPVLPAPPPIPLTFKVKHLHKHSHIHVVHHTTTTTTAAATTTTPSNVTNEDEINHQSLVLLHGASQ